MEADCNDRMEEKEEELPVHIEVCPLVLHPPQHITADLQDGELKPLAKLSWSLPRSGDGSSVSHTLTATLQSLSVASRFHVDFLGNLRQQSYSCLHRAASRLYDEGFLLTSVSLARDRLVIAISWDETQPRAKRSDVDVAKIWSVVKEELLPRWAWSSNEVRLNFLTQHTESDMEKRLSNLETMYTASAEQTSNQLRTLENVLERLTTHVLASYGKVATSSPSQQEPETVFHPSKGPGSLQSSLNTNSRSQEVMQYRVEVPTELRHLENRRREGIKGDDEFGDGDSGIGSSRGSSRRSSFSSLPSATSDVKWDLRGRKAKGEFSEAPVFFKNHIRPGNCDATVAAIDMDYAERLEKQRLLGISDEKMLRYLLGKDSEIVGHANPFSPNGTPQETTSDLETMLEKTQTPYHRYPLKSELSMPDRRSLAQEGESTGASGDAQTSATIDQSAPVEAYAQSTAPATGNPGLGQLTVVRVVQPPPPSQSEHTTLSSQSSTESQAYNDTRWQDASAQSHSDRVKRASQSPSPTPPRSSPHPSNQSPPQSSPPAPTRFQSQPPPQPPSQNTPRPTPHPSNQSPPQSPPQSSPQAPTRFPSQPPPQPPSQNTPRPTPHPSNQSPPQSSPQAPTRFPPQPPPQPPSQNTPRPAPHPSNQSPPQSSPQTPTRFQSQPPPQPPNQNAPRPAPHPSNQSPPQSPQEPESGRFNVMPQPPNSFSSQNSSRPPQSSPQPQQPSSLPRSQNSPHSAQSPTNAPTQGGTMGKNFDSFEEDGSSGPSIERMVQRLDQARAFADIEATPSPRSPNAMDTVLCLDVSASMQASGAFRELKTAALDFLEGIEERTVEAGLEENIALVTMGGGATIRQHLTNDYGLLRDAIDSLSPSGSSPFMQTLLVCMQALKGRGGVVSVGRGGYKILPRIVIFTDGIPSDEATEPLAGTDPPITDMRFRMMFISAMPKITQLLKKMRLYWVPVGEATGMLESLQKLGVGTIVYRENRAGLTKDQFVQNVAGRVCYLVKDLPELRGKNSEAKLNRAVVEPYVQVMAPNTTPSDQAEILKIVEEKLTKARRGDNSDDDSSDSEDEGGSDSLPLGTRVVRGPDWRWNDQDRGGPGIVIKRKRQGRHLVVRWDWGKAGLYRYNYHGKVDVLPAPADTPPVHLGDRLLCVGLAVQRGSDWSSGDEDGGPGARGIVLACKDDGRVKVVWKNGLAKMYRFGKDDKYEVKVCDDTTSETSAPFTQDINNRPAAQGTIRSLSPPGVSRLPGQRLLWEWQDEKGQWHHYGNQDQAKLNAAYSRKPTGSCLVVRDGVSYRVLFKDMRERDNERSVSHAVRKSVDRDMNSL